jgi:hypothetical protein
MSECIIGTTQNAQLIVNVCMCICMHSCIRKNMYSRNCPARTAHAHRKSQYRHIHTHSYIYIGFQCRHKKGSRAYQSSRPYTYIHTYIHTYIGIQCVSEGHWKGPRAYQSNHPGMHVCNCMCLLVYAFMYLCVCVHA